MTRARHNLNLALRGIEEKLGANHFLLPEVRRIESAVEDLADFEATWEQLEYRTAGIETKDIKETAA